ncbi:MAG TPA: hypothetical protein VF796_14915 [Humisphaera sp.]
MQPHEFVASLRRVTRQSVTSTVDYLANPPVPEPPGYLGEFARWWKGLSDQQRVVARDLLEYVAEGSLFHLLTVLDGTSTLEGHEGTFELFHVIGESRTRLNDPDENLLCDLFNNTG